MKDFSIYLTFDIDQDYAPGTGNYFNRSQTNFSSFQNGFMKTIESMDEKAYSVFIRADNQIKESYGSHTHLIENNQNVIDSIHKSNGELNWHIHLYELINDTWSQIVDESKLVDSFMADFHAIKDVDVLNLSILRVGELTMTNRLMKAINDCNIKIDSTALPGRKRDDVDKKFDWLTSTNKNYFPSVNDYRVQGTKNYNVLEVPMTTIPMQATYDLKEIKRYFNLGFRTEVLFQNFPSFIQTNDSLVTISHPFELLPNKEHGLIAYDLGVFKENLKIMERMIREAGKNPVYRKIGDLI